MNQLVLHTGANLGARQQNLQKANTLIEQKIGKIELQSGFYETKAWGNTEQPDFVNQAMLVSTKLSLLEIHEQTLEIELLLGKKKLGHWQARHIDIDLLFFNAIVLKTERLIIPHPLLHVRDFVLIPLAEILPDWNHPVFNKTVLELKEGL